MRKLSLKATQAAMLAAADHIENNPQLYEFVNCSIPESEKNCCACMVGWTAYYAFGQKFQRIGKTEELLGFAWYQLTDFFNDHNPDATPDGYNSRVAPTILRYGAKHIRALRKFANI